MLTLRQVKGEYEEVREVRHVWLRGQGTFEDPLKATVGAELPTGETLILEEGDIYVMNENGKTVADYHLGPQPFESVEDSKKRSIKK